MRFTLVALVASLVSIVAAQTAGLPTCVSGCYASSLAADPSCTSTDLACLCKSAKFSAAVSSCFVSSCTSAADQAAGIAFAYQSCLAVGITIATSALPAATSGAVAGNSTSVAASTRPASASAVPATITSASASPAATTAPSSTTSTRSDASVLKLQGILGFVALVAAFVL